MASAIRRLTLRRSAMGDGGRIRSPSFQRRRLAHLDCRGLSTRPRMLAITAWRSCARAMTPSRPSMTRRSVLGRFSRGGHSPVPGRAWRRSYPTSARKHPGLRSVALSRISPRGGAGLTSVKVLTEVASAGKRTFGRTVHRLRTQPHGIRRSSQSYSVASRPGPTNSAAGHVFAACGFASSMGSTCSRPDFRTPNSSRRFPTWSRTTSRPRSPSRPAGSITR